MQAFIHSDAGSGKIGRPVACVLAQQACHSMETTECFSNDLFNGKKVIVGMPQHGSDEMTVAQLRETLLKVGSSHDREAFRVVYDHFSARIRSFMLKRSHNASAAEEIAQETMINIWRKAAQYDPDKASPSTWVFTIARNIQIDLFRKANRPAFDPDDPAFVPDAEPLASDIISKEREVARLKTVVASLPKEQQDVLNLAFFQEKPHPVVAEELDVPLGTVKSRIRLAFKRIRSELGDQI